MPLSVNDVIARLASSATPVLKILDVGGREWHRKPKDGRRGPWLSAKYHVINQTVWERRGPCIYFVHDSPGILRYVGISLNKLDDRWRTSPAYTATDSLLPGDELFHSQCWHKIAHPTERAAGAPFTVSVLAGVEALSLLATIDHELSALSVLRKDPEIIVTVLELWICKYGHETLWNKALTGGKKPRAKRGDG